MSIVSPQPPKRKPTRRDKEGYSATSQIGRATLAGRSFQTASHMSKFSGTETKISASDDPPKKDMHSVRTIHDEATVRLGEVPRPARREKKRLEWAVKCRLRSVCFRVNARWHAPALSYTPIPWAVSGTTASETRAPLRSPPSSRRLRSPTSSEPLPQVFDFVSAPVDTRLLPPIPCNPPLRWVSKYMSRF